MLGSTRLEALHAQLATLLENAQYLLASEAPSTATTSTYGYGYGPGAASGQYGYGSRLLQQTTVNQQGGQYTPPQPAVYSLINMQVIECHLLSINLSLRASPSYPPITTFYGMR